MNDVEPLQTLFDGTEGFALRLPPPLSAFYGSLRFPSPRRRPYVFGNLAETMDGIVAFEGSEASGGGAITGSDPRDRALMGLLRAVADGVIVGAGTLRSVPHHRWTGEHIFPPLAAAYRQLRTATGKPSAPLNVIVTQRGKLDWSLPVFRSGEVPSLVVTSVEGFHRIRLRDLPSGVRVVRVPGRDRLSATTVVKAVHRLQPSERLLVEGGPHLLAGFLAEAALDELFLTISPQFGGRSAATQRLGLVEGRTFGPRDALWASLRGVKRGGSHLFLRYGLTGRGGTPPSIPDRSAPHSRRRKLSVAGRRWRSV
ncbi:MAG: RibD family protein [Thermoplasmata archaeon]